MEKKSIKTLQGLEGEYEVENNFSMKIWMIKPYNVYVEVELKAGTFRNEDEIEEFASSELQYIYDCIEIIKNDLEEFEKLSVSYSSCESGWHIKLFNKIFYSSYEEERFRLDMKQSLKENYNRMYDEYIKNPNPFYRFFKNKLSPTILPILIKAIHEKD